MTVVYTILQLSLQNFPTGPSEQQRLKTQIRLLQDDHRSGSTLLAILLASLGVHFYMSLVLRKPSSRFPTRSDTNRAAQPQKMARGLKFSI